MNKLAKHALTAALGLAITFTLNACKEEKFVLGTFTDPRDGKEYKTTKIGEQIWMAENLNYEVNCSGCYNNYPANCQKYGRLYDWETARRACPKGWHLPSNDEWNILYGAIVSGYDLKAKSGWPEGKDGEGGNGEDKYGFSALPGGTAWGSNYIDFGEDAHWWSDFGSYNINGRIMEYMYNGDTYPTPEGPLYFSIRCLQNNADYAAKEKEAEAEIAKEMEEKMAQEAAAKLKREKVKKGSFTDTRNGKAYKTVKLDKQTWMAENLNYAVEGSVCPDNDDDNCKKFGRLYDKETAMKVCPSGWHLPSEKEWKALFDFANYDGNLKAKSIWKEGGDYASKCLDTVEDFTDDYGFSALPGGYGFRESSTDEDGDSNSSYSFGGSGVGGNWWNSAGSYESIYGNDGGWGGSEFEANYWNGEGPGDSNNKTFLFYVRCVQN